MRITRSKLEGAFIHIDYSDMADPCLKDSPITITCKHFYNPITPEVWPGFSIEIYDSEI